MLRAGFMRIDFDNSLSTEKLGGLDLWLDPHGY